MIWNFLVECKYFLQCVAEILDVIWHNFPHWLVPAKEMKPCTQNRKHITPMDVLASEDKRVTKKLFSAKGKHTYSHWIAQGTLKIICIWSI